MHPRIRKIAPVKIPYPGRMLYLLFITVLWPAGICQAADGERFVPVSGHYGAASCILDRDSGLLWERKQAHNRTHHYSWELSQRIAPLPGCETTPCTVSAYVAHVNRIGLCGRNNWRVPSFFELTTLVSYQHHRPAVMPRWFGNTATEFYWSASAQQDNNHWGTGFTWGFDYAYDRQMPGALRLVSGNQDRIQLCDKLARRFIRQDNGELLDSYDNIRWAPCPDGQGWEEKQCRGQAQSSTLTGFDTAAADTEQLPTIRELRSLINPDCPGIGPGADLNAHLWSAEHQDGISSRQWALQFPSGQAFTLERTQQALLWRIRDRRQ